MWVGPIAFIQWGPNIPISGPTEPHMLHWKSIAIPKSNLVPRRNNYENQCRCYVCNFAFIDRASAAEASSAQRKEEVKYKLSLILCLETQKPLLLYYCKLIMYN